MNFKKIYFYYLKSTNLITSRLKNNIDAQCQALLAPSIHCYVETLPWFYSFDDQHYGDLFCVTPAILSAYILRNGFDDRIVSSEYSQEQHCYEQIESGWRLYYVDRGERSDIATFDRYETMVSYLAKSFIRNAIVSASAHFRIKHFNALEGPLPKSGQPWPDGRVRY